MNRVFLDANVLFTAAHNPQGKAAFVIELGIRGQWRLYTSALAVEEARRNLEIKFPSSLERFRHFLQGLVILSMHPDHPAPVVLPDKDRPIFQAAVECRATHLLTGDIKDFGPLMNKPELTGGIIIQTVAHFLEKLQTPAS